LGFERFSFCAARALLVREEILVMDARTTTAIISHRRRAAVLTP